VAEVRADGDVGSRRLSVSRLLESRRAWKSLALGMVLGDGTDVRRGSTYEQGESGRGEGR
jgi:hypothetical protein